MMTDEDLYDVFGRTEAILDGCNLACVQRPLLNTSERAVLIPSTAISSSE